MAPSLQRVPQGVLLFLFIPRDEAVAIQNLHVFGKTLVEGMRLLTEALVHQLAKGGEVLLSVHQRPEEAAHGIQVDETYLGFPQELLGNAVGDAHVIPLQGDDAILPCRPAEGGVAHRLAQEIVFGNDVLFLHLTSASSTKCT